MFKLTSLPGIVELLQFGQHMDGDVFLVGGAIRDALLNRPVKDIDLIVPDKARQLARTFARKNNYPFFALHAERGIFRVMPAADFAIDFSDFQGASLEEDLGNRDFTINALAISLKANAGRLLTGGTITEFIDLSGGLKDLGQRTIRLISSEAFRQDPLRMLRAFRFMSELDFSVTPDILQLVKEQAGLITGVAAERILHELNLTLASRYLPAGQAMIDTGLLPLVLQSSLGGDIDPATADRQFRTAIKKMERLERLRRDLNSTSPRAASWLTAYFREKLSGGLVRQSLFILYLLLPENWPGLDLELFCSRLTLSRAACRSLKTWRKIKPDARSLLASGRWAEDRPRQSFLFHHREEGIISFLETILTGDVSEEGENLPREYLPLFIEELTRAAPARDRLITRVNGKSIMALTGLKPGQNVGRILTMIQEQIYTGDLRTWQDVTDAIKDAALSTLPDS